MEIQYYQRVQKIRAVELQTSQLSKKVARPLPLRQFSFIACLLGFLKPGQT